MRELIDEFIRYAKEQFGYDVFLEEATEPDTFQVLFSANFIKQNDEEILAFLKAE